MKSSVATWMHKRPKFRLVALLAAPTLWLVVAYLGALGALLITAFLLLIRLPEMLSRNLIWATFMTCSLTLRIEM